MRNFKLLALTVLMALVSSATAFAHDFEAENSDGITIYYNITSSEDLTCAVSNRYGSGSYSGNVAIPSTVTNDGKTYSVTSIGRSAFYNCSSLQSVIIPNSVTSIGEYAFRDCPSLQSVTIPNSVTSIGEWAFRECSSLQSVTIPNSVTSIGEWAFSGCSSLQSMTIPNSVTSIGNSAFSYSSNLKSVIIGTGVRSIGRDAFDECPLYKVVLLPNTVPSGACYGKITYVANNNYSGSSVKKYDYLSSYFEVDGIIYVPISPSEKTCAAIDCTYDADVKNIVIGETVSYRGVEMKVVEINPYLLIGNEYIESVSVSIPTNIPDNFAKGCSALKSLSLPKTATSIESSAFSGCSSLTDITLPEGLQTQAVCNNA